MMPIGNFIRDALTHNAFMTGGLAMMIVGAIMVQLKAIPQQIFDWILYHTMLTCSITDDSHAFFWYAYWFHEQPKAKRIRHVDVSTPLTSSGERKPVIKPAPGSHWFMYRGRPIRLTATRTEEKSFGTTQRNEKVLISTFGRNRIFLDRFVEDLYNSFQEAAHSEVKLFLWKSSYWDDAPFDPRPLDSVILKKGMKEEIVHDIEQFKKDHAFYRRTGMPYHRSYLLYGPPGTGKTSTLLGLASHFKANVHLLKLGSMSDTTLIESLQEVRQNSMVILEDVDCLVDKRSGVTTDRYQRAGMKKIGRRKYRYSMKSPEAPMDPDGDEGDKKTLGVTLSGILNALDGIETPSGVIFMLTTNLIERLDEALLRPGRIDMKLHIGVADDDQKTQMFERFFPDELGAAADFIQRFPQAATMAAFQEQLKLKKNGVIS